MLAMLHSGEFALTRPGTSVTLVRHANASTPPGGKDGDRRISEKGLKQCKAMAENFKFYGNANIRLKSPLPRVSDTIKALDQQPQDFVSTPELFVPYDPTSRNNGVLDAAYQILGGNIGLYEILKHSEVAVALDVATASALALIHNAIKARDMGYSDTVVTVCAVGHGWFLPAMAYYLAGTNEVARRHLLQHPMGECEIMQLGLDFEGKHVWKRFPCPAV